MPQRKKWSIQIIEDKKVSYYGEERLKFGYVQKAEVRSYKKKAAIKVQL